MKHEFMFYFRFELMFYFTAHASSEVRPAMQDGCNPYGVILVDGACSTKLLLLRSRIKFYGGISEDQCC